MLKTRKVDTALQRKGFVKDNEGHHVYYYFYIEGKKTKIKTKISHGVSEISENLISLMSRQVKLKKKQFVDLVECPLTQQKYQRLLIENKYIKVSDYIN